MYIDPKEIAGTKIIVNRKDVKAVEKVLFKHDYGYELNLDKDFNHRKYSNDVCFLIDYHGYIVTVEKDPKDDEDFWKSFYGSLFEEIHWSALF